MTTISILKQNGRIFGLNVSGHSGKAKAGDDVVCAAISEAVRYTANLLEAFGRKTTVRTNEKTAEISLSVAVPDNTSDTVFKTFQSEMSLVSEEYPKNVVIHIMEV